MSSNLGRTLYTSFWAAANPLFARGLRGSRTHFFADTANTSRSATDLLPRQTARRVSTSPFPKSTRITKRFASGSFLAFGFSPSSPAVENGTTCAIASDKIISHRSHRRAVPSLIQNAWKRDFYTTKNVRSRTENSKEPSNTTADSSRRERDQVTDHTRSQNSGAERPDKLTRESQQWMSSNRHIFNRLPNMTHLHRPTKEELLAAATGFWSRLKIRFKWFSIRSMRPFNLDEIAALFSWVLLGHIVWIVVGTTTFFSLLILAINTVFAQGKTNDMADLSA